MGKILIGIAIWVVLALGLWQQMQRVEPGRTHPAGQVWRYLIQPTREIELQLVPEMIVKVGDPVYSSDRTIQAPIGRISRVHSRDSLEVAETYASFIVVELNSLCPPLTPESRFFYQETPLSLEWVLETMLPESKRREISELIAAAMQEHRDELWQELQPIVQRLVRESQAVIVDEFQSALAQRAPLVNEIFERYRAEFIESEVLPVFEREVWPIIQRESAPLVQVIGTELWSQASLWRLTWKYLYDASPLPQRDLTRKEFNRFLEEKAKPVVHKHWPEILEAQRRIFQEISRNAAVEQLIRSGADRIAGDEDVKQLVIEITRDALLNNERLRTVWQETWNSPEMQRVMVDANDRLGPTVTQIGEALFGNPRKQITPEFSDVLRSRVLFKDSRWLVLEDVADAKSDPGTVLPGPPNPVRPFHLPATKRQ